MLPTELKQLPLRISRAYGRVSHSPAAADGPGRSSTCRKERVRKLSWSLLPELQCLFHPLLLGDVASDGRTADHFTGFVPDRRQGDRTDGAGHPGQSDRFPMGYADPAITAASVSGTVEPVGRDQNRHRLPNDLIRPISVNSLGAAIPTHNPAIQPLGHNGVFSTVHDGSQICLDCAPAYARLCRGRSPPQP